MLDLMPADIVRIAPVFCCSSTLCEHIITRETKFSPLTFVQCSRFFTTIILLDTWSHSDAQAVLNLEMLWSHLPGHWDYRCVSLCPAVK